MYKIIDDFPSKREQEAFDMKEAQEDTYDDFSVELSALDEAEKESLCNTYGIDARRLEGESVVTLTVLTSI